MASAIEFEGVWKSYRKHVVLRSVGFSIPRGAVVALVGRVGAGKSTMLQLLSGLRRPDKGMVLVNDREPCADPLWLASVGFVDQGPALPYWSTLAGLERVARATNPSWDQQFYHRLVKRFDLPTKRPISRLSGGQSHICAVILALCKRPSTLLLDEPLASLDPGTRREILGSILAYAEETAATVLMSSHVVTDLERTCDRILILDHSEVVVDDSMDHVLATHAWLDAGTKPGTAVGYKLLVDGGARRLVQFQKDPPSERYLTPAGLEEIVVAYISGKAGVGEEAMQQ